MLTDGISTIRQLFSLRTFVAPVKRILYFVSFSGYFINILNTLIYCVSVEGAKPFL